MAVTRTRRARRFKANGRVYPDTPAGHLRAAVDKAKTAASGRGHDMMHWSRHARPGMKPYYTARCGKCRGGIIVTAGQAPRNDPAYPRAKVVRWGRISTCPGR